MAIFTKNEAGPFFSSQYPGIGSLYVDITDLQKIFNEKFLEKSFLQKNLTNAGPENAAGEGRPAGLLLHQILGGSLGVGVEVRPASE